MQQLFHKQSTLDLARAFLRSRLVWHYFRGKGRTFDLGRNGLLGEFRNTASIRANVQMFRQSVERNIEQAAKKSAPQSGQRGKSLSKTFSDRLAYDVTLAGPQMLPIGNGYLKCRATCNIDIAPGGTAYTATCGLVFSMQDRFEKPLDIHDTGRFEGEIVFGTPYTIIARWSEAMSIRPTRIN